MGLLALISSLVGCDHASKHVAKATLEDGGAAPLIRNVLDLHYLENRDIAFNLLRWIPESVRSQLLLVSGALAIFALAVLVFARPTGSRWKTIALAAVLAGAVGNYLDRALRGYVVDFVHVTHWPVFNVADVYVTLGALALLLLGGRRTALRDSPG